MSDAGSTPDVALFEDDPGPLDGVIDDEDEDLKLDNVDTKVWLVKVNIMGDISFNVLHTDRCVCPPLASSISRRTMESNRRG